MDDPARLISILNRSGLQSRDKTTYEVIKDLISATGELNKNAATLVQQVLGSGAVLGPTGVIPGTYGDSSHVGQFTVGLDGRLTAAANVAVAAGAGSWVPMVTGAEPAVLLDDGAGDLIFVLFFP